MYKRVLSENAPEPLGKWTDSKIELVELAIGIKNSVNNGDVTMTKIQETLEYTFQTELGNIFDRYREIESRKRKSATAYPEELQKRLEHFLEERAK